MEHGERLERKRQQLLKNLQKMCDLLQAQGDVKYVVCARVRDAETDKVIMGMLTNMSYADQQGEMVPATPGMLLDVILEAMLEGPPIPGVEQMQMPKNPYKM
jgi:hypothetical protein